MTITQALERGLLAKLKATEPSEGGRTCSTICHSPSTGERYDAILYTQTGEVQIIGPLPEEGDGSPVRAVPDDTVW